MTKAAEQLLEQALELDSADRAALVDELIVTLEPSTDPAYVAEWINEIQHRIEEHESGQVKALPWEEARKRIFGETESDA